MTFPVQRKTSREIEAVGLAIMGGLGAFYVGALGAKAHIGEFKSIGALLSLVVFGFSGFYVGSNPPFGAVAAVMRADSVKRSPFQVRQWHFLAFVGAIGTLSSSVAALVSVLMIVFDEIPGTPWNFGVVFTWMFGVLLKLAIGVAVRLERPPALDG